MRKRAKEYKQWVNTPRRGYTLKWTDVVGYWVDGNCGYKVVGYYNDRDECLKDARAAIKNATTQVWRVL